jgi:energy-coupling factor transporter transmembrane protein EcfT
MNNHNCQHPFILFTATLTTLLVIFFTSSLYAPFLGVALFLSFFWRQQKIGTFLKVLLMAAFFTSSYLLTLIVHANNGLSLPILSKIFSMTVISLSSSLLLNTSIFFISLMTQFKLDVVWGHSLLIATNSIILLKEEYARLRLNLIMRGFSVWQRHLVLFPLLTFAIRQAERGALSLVTRGLNPQKTYLHSYFISKKDWFILLFYFLCGATLISIYKYFSP